MEQIVPIEEQTQIFSTGWRRDQLLALLKTSLASLKRLNDFSPNAEKQNAVACRLSQSLMKTSQLQPILGDFCEC